VAGDDGAEAAREELLTPEGLAAMAALSGSPSAMVSTARCPSCGRDGHSHRHYGSLAERDGLAPVAVYGRHRRSHCRYGGLAERNAQVAASRLASCNLDK
jgi:hypothetical protein